MAHDKRITLHHLQLILLDLKMLAFQLNNISVVVSLSSSLSGFLELPVVQTELERQQDEDAVA